jgi:hypothetical protein
MEQTEYDFNSSDLQDVDSDFKPLPKGNYLIEIDVCDRVDTKTLNDQGNPKGENLHLQFTVLEGEGKNRRVYANHLIRHENPTATEMGRNKIAELGKAVGLESFNIESTFQFLNKVLRVDLEVKAASNGYPAGNEVVRYMAYQDVKKPAKHDAVNVVIPPASEAVKDDIPF